MQSKVLLGPMYVCMCMVFKPDKKRRGEEELLLGERALESVNIQSMEGRSRWNVRQIPIERRWLGIGGLKINHSQCSAATLGGEVIGWLLGSSYERDRERAGFFLPLVI